jgi:hypothetical protein
MYNSLTKCRDSVAQQKQSVQVLEPGCLCLSPDWSLFSCQSQDKEQFFWKYFPIYKNGENSNICALQFWWQLNELM